MFKDLNRPDGFYGELYDKQTGGKYRTNNIERPVVAMWKEIEIDELLLDIKKHNGTY